MCYFWTSYPSRLSVRRENDPGAFSRGLRQGLAKAKELLRAVGGRDRQPETAVAERIGSGDGLPDAGGRPAGGVKAGCEVNVGVE